LQIRPALTTLSGVPPRTGVDPALGATLRALRQARGIGQETLAHHAGLSVATYARIERGQVNPTWTTVRRILQALGVSLAEFGATVDSSNRLADSNG
jgi:transcriptional regulator with XRE-family HTH domain